MQEDLSKEVKASFNWQNDLLIKALLVLILLNLIFLNGSLVWIKFFSNKQGAKEQAKIAITENAVFDPSDLEILRGKLEAVEASLSAKTACFDVSDTVDQTPLSAGGKASTTAPPSPKKISHQLKDISFPGAHGTNDTTWWSIPGMETTFEIEHFPNYTAYWEALLRIKGGEGRAYARIFDTFAGIPVDGSEIETGSDSLVRISSGSLKFWPGSRKYQVQIKSLFGPEAVVEDAKIRISWIKEE